MSSTYYIYQMMALTEDGSKGSYIGQHKIGRKSPLEDGYKGSGKAWKKYILSQNIPVEKVILRMCENIEDANYWEQYYIESAKAQGIYLWNRCKGGGSHQYDKIYTEEELKEHRNECMKRYYEANKAQIAEHQKEYYEANKEHYKMLNKQWYEANKAQIAEQKKQYYEANKEHIAEYKKQYYNQLCKYNDEVLTLNALRIRFKRAGITNPTAEAKKYLLTKANIEQPE